MNARQKRRQASARGVIAWAAFLVLSISCAVAYNGERSWGLAALIAGSFVVLCVALVGFDRASWVATAEQSAEYALIDADLVADSRAHEARREERHPSRRLNT